MNIQNPLLITGTVLVAAWMTTGTGMAQSSGTVHPSPNSSVGGSQSERSGETGVPMPKGSRESGTTDMGKSGAGDSGANATGSQRMSGSSSTSSSAMSNHGSENIKEAQQALKDKGYDPGPVDGVMGSRTKQAIKNFQNASNLKATGTLDSQTAEKLGVQSNASTTGSSSTGSSSSGSMGSSSSKMSDHSGQSSSKNR